MLSRYFISFNFAAIITFAIFYSMQMLISQGDITLNEKSKRVVVLIDGPREIETLKTRELPPVKQEFREAPVSKRFDPLITEDATPPVLTQVKIVAPKPGVASRLITTDGDFLSIVRPVPRYPDAMATKGIEGYVRLKYTVTENGSTKDVVVMSSSNRGFERNAVKAAEKFKFMPRVENGVAVAVFDVYNTIVFKLEGLD